MLVMDEFVPICFFSRSSFYLEGLSDPKRVALRDEVQGQPQLSSGLCVLSAEWGSARNIRA